MYDLIIDVCGFPEDFITNNPELVEIAVAGLSCVMICVCIYMFCKFFLDLFRGTK